MGERDVSSPRRPVRPGAGRAVDLERQAMRRTLGSAVPASDRLLADRRPSISASGSSGKPTLRNSSLSGNPPYSPSKTSRPGTPTHTPTGSNVTAAVHQHLTSFGYEDVDGGDVSEYGSKTSNKEDVVGDSNDGTDSTDGDSKGNVKVCVRFRPQNLIEDECGGVSVVELTDSNVRMKDPGSFKGGIDFTFDRVFAEDSTQQSVYEYVGRPLVSDVLNGYNCSLITYGQTGSGKTHTLMGGEEPELQGVIPRIVDDIFCYMEKAPASCEFTLRISYVEIYLERITDLLKPEHTDLKLREDVVRGLHLEGAEEVYVASREELYELMRRGSQNRTVATTRMNADSSRSHSVFIITAEQTDAAAGLRKSAQLFLVDLAGSESISKTHASGQTLQEAKQINRSLSALGNVIKALVERQRHIPYRDSKLTRLLQDALGGNSKTSLVITCSGSSYNQSETLSTLRFGTRAKAIHNKPKVNQERSLEEYKRLLEAVTARERDLQMIIQKLEAQVQELLSQNVTQPRILTPQSRVVDEALSSSSTRVVESPALSAAGIICQELSGMVKVFQPLALELRDQLTAQADVQWKEELDALAQALMEASVKQQSSAMSSGILRLVQVLKEALSDKNMLCAAQERVIHASQKLISDKDKKVAAMQRELTELHAAQARTASEAMAAAKEQKRVAAMVAEQLAGLQADIARKDYELKEQALIVGQLRQTLDSLTAAVPSASIVASVAASSTPAPVKAVKSEEHADNEGNGVFQLEPARDLNKADDRVALLEEDLRDLMTRFVDMRMKYEEERSVVQQLTDVVDEMRGEQDAGGQADQHAASAIVDLRRALDRRSLELQEKGALVESLVAGRSTMEGQLSLRDERIKHLEALVTNLQEKVKQGLDRPTATTEQSGPDSCPDPPSGRIPSRLATPDFGVFTRSNSGSTPSSGPDHEQPHTPVLGSPATVISSLKDSVTSSLSTSGAGRLTNWLSSPSEGETTTGLAAWAEWLGGRRDSGSSPERRPSITMRKVIRGKGQ